MKKLSIISVGVLVTALISATAASAQFAPTIQEQLDKLSKQIHALGVYGVDTRVDLNGDIGSLSKDFTKYKQETNYKIEEIERKLAGVQGQVTVLHAKKLDRPASTK